MLLAIPSYTAAPFAAALPPSRPLLTSTTHAHKNKQIGRGFYNWVKPVSSPSSLGSGPESWLEYKLLCPAWGSKAGGKGWVKMAQRCESEMGEGVPRIRGGLHKGGTALLCECMHVYQREGGAAAAAQTIGCGMAKPMWKQARR